MAQSQPDVRVRLSAEGVQDVVAAFKKIEAEARKAGEGHKAGAEGAKLFKEQLGGIIELLPELTLAAAAIGFVEMTKHAIETAVEIGRLEQKTGVAVETLGVYSFAAQQAGLDTEAMSKSIIKAARFFDEYDSGATGAREAVEKLLGSQNALQGLTADEKLRRVTDALAGMEPSAKRTALAIEIFGKSGAQILPTLDKLGGQGFDALKAKAEKLGVIIDSDLVRSAEDAHAALKDLQAAAQGTATQFAAGFAPALADVSHALVDGLTVDGVSGFKTLGEFAGETLKGIILLVVAVVAGLIEIGAKASALVQNLGGLAIHTLKEGPKAAWEQFKRDMSADVDRINTFIQERETAILAALDGSHRDNATKKPKRDVELSENKDTLNRAIALSEAKRKLTEANLNAELAILKASNKQTADFEKEQFDERLIGVDQYYKDRADRINSEADAEIKLIKAKIQAETDALNFERKRSLKKGENEADRQKNVTERRTSIIGLQGQVTVADINRNTELNANAAQAAKAAFDSAVESGQLALSQLASGRQAIDDKVKGGQIFAIQGEQQIRELEQSRLPLLQQIAEAMQAAAITPEQKQQADEFAASVRGIGIAANEAAQRSAQMKAAFQSAVSDDLLNWLETGITDAESFGDAMRSLAASVVQSLQKIAAQMLATIAIKKLFGSGDDDGGGGLLGGFFGKIFKFNSGGQVPGIGNGDSVPAWLTPGEVVIRKSAVSQPGVLPLLEALNGGLNGGLVRRRAAYFADGGMVDSMAAVPEGGGRGQSGRNADLRATLDVDPVLLLKRLEATPEWSRVHVRTAETHRNKINKALGK
jgi:hypothetical protein